MSSTNQPVAALLDGLATAAVEIVDLTQPLSESTPVIKLPPPFANTPGLSPRGDQPLRRPRPRVGVVHADDRRARRHAPRRADPLGHRQGRRRRRLGRAEPADRARVRDRQDRRDRGRQRLPADRRRPRGLGGRERPDPRPRLGAAAHRLAVARAGRDRVPQRRRERSRDARARRRGVAVARERARRSPASAPRRSGSTPAPRAASTRRSRSTTCCSAPAGCGLTQLANLDKLPITGALIVVSPLKLVGGTGSPSRVFAFVPKG